MTKNAHGNDVVALLNGLLGNILGIFISPALIYLFMAKSAVIAVRKQFDLTSYLQVIRKLSLSVLLPLFVGQVIHRMWTETVLQAKVKLHFTEVNSVTLLTVSYTHLTLPTILRV